MIAESSDVGVFVSAHRWIFNVFSEGKMRSLDCAEVLFLPPASGNLKGFPSTTSEAPACGQHAVVLHLLARERLPADRASPLPKLRSHLRRTTALASSDREARRRQRQGAARCRRGRGGPYIY
eukprot:1067953-Prymnesium_polylepis.1